MLLILIQHEEGYWGQTPISEFLRSEPKFAEPTARPEGVVRCTAAKLVSDPNNSYEGRAKGTMNLDSDPNNPPNHIGKPT